MSYKVLFSFCLFIYLINKIVFIVVTDYEFGRHLNYVFFNPLAIVHIIYYMLLSTLNTKEGRLIKKPHY